MILDAIRIIRTLLIISGLFGVLIENMRWKLIDLLGSFGMRSGFEYLGRIELRFFIGKLLDLHLFASCSNCIAS